MTLAVYEGMGVRRGGGVMTRRRRCYLEDALCIVSRETHESIFVAAISSSRPLFGPTHLQCDAAKDAIKDDLRRHAWIFGRDVKNDARRTRNCRGFWQEVYTQGKGASITQSCHVIRDDSDVTHRYGRF